MKQDPRQRFTRLVGEPDDSGCWPWMGALDRLGRGSFHLDGRTRTASRVAAEFAGLAPGPRDCVCHRCDNPRCVNPAHLFIGSQQDNLADMRAKGRAVFPVAPPWRGIKYPRAKVDAALALRASGLTQGEIGAAVGMSQPHVSRLFAGLVRKEL